MTEGDITRLNRMYKCPEWIEQEQDYDQVDGSVKGKPNPSKVLVETTDKTRSGSVSEAPDNLLTISNNKPNVLVMYLRSAMNILFSAFAPLFSLQEKLANIVEKIESRSVP